MLRPVRKLVWEDAYSVINPQLTASGVHEWNFDRSFPIDLRFFIMRREADIRLNHHAYFELLHVTSGEVEYQVGDRNYTLRQGDLFVMAAALPHRMRRYGRSQIRCVTLYFMPEIIRGHDSTSDDVQYLMPFLVQNSGFPHVVPAESGVPAQILEFMKKIYELDDRQVATCMSSWCVYGRLESTRQDSIAPTDPGIRTPCPDPLRWDSVEDVVHCRDMGAGFASGTRIDHCGFRSSRHFTMSRHWRPCRPRDISV